MTSKLGQDSPCGILCYIWESWDEQRDILTLVLEGKQLTARQRTGKRYARQGGSICRGAEKEEEWHVRGTQTAH